MRVDHSRGRSSDKIRQAAAKQSGRTLLGQGRAEKARPAFTTTGLYIIWSPTGCLRWQGGTIHYF